MHAHTHIHMAQLVKTATVFTFLLKYFFQTGRSKGYAFVEFEHPEVAKIAAEAMNDYLMFDRLIKG